MDNHFQIMSPRTRRLHRGRGPGVLSNVTASNMTNNINISTPSFSADSSFGEDFGPSPDEMIITARGRRALPLTFSPDVHSTPPRGIGGNPRSMSKLARPNTGIARLLLPTRTSPRKRLTLSDSPPTNSSSSVVTNTPSPDPKNIGKRSPNNKKSRLVLEEFSTGNSGDRTPTALSTPTVLKGLSRKQLMDVLKDLLDKRPELEEDVRQSLPKPDLSVFEERLNYLKRNISRALPNTRLESKTDSMAYSRVAVHLLAFKKELSDQGKRLIEANAWSSVVNHGIMAWNYVEATPNWDNATHNNIKKQCFKALASNLNLALKRGTWTAEVSMNIKNKLLPMEKDAEDIGLCIKHLDLIINNGNNNVTSSTQE